MRTYNYDTKKFEVRTEEDIYEERMEAIRSKSLWEKILLVMNDLDFSDKDLQRAIVLAMRNTIKNEHDFWETLLEYCIDSHKTSELNQYINNLVYDLGIE